MGKWYREILLTLKIVSAKLNIAVFLKEIFGRIVSMVLEWFHLVVYMPSDSSGEIISKIRTQVRLL